MKLRVWANIHRNDEPGSALGGRVFDLEFEDLVPDDQLEDLVRQIVTDRTFIHFEEVTETHDPDAHD